MQVVTLSPSNFAEHARRLAQDVEKGSDICFDAILAVKRGGSFVCDAFCRYFPGNRYGKRFDVSLQRPSTKRKEGRIGRWLKRLPLPLLNAMRIVEASMLSLRRRLKKDTTRTDVTLPDDMCAILTTDGKPRILIIDDAIDSGDTIFSISEKIKEINPETIICIAVMTETTSRPRIRANYTLYRNKTLIRFPWSNDYKGN